jgi:ribosome-binding protein aMBF1 (putative translation factor)
MKTRNRKTSDGVRILHKRFYAGRTDRLAALEEARANDQVARELQALRQRAGLTQKQLAALVGTTPSVISRLEDADYEGHSMAMLRRVAGALNRRVEIRFIPVHRKLQAA